MKLEKLAAIAEIAANAAVIVSLIILILEVRENTAVMQANSRQSLAERRETFLLSRAEAPHLAPVLVRADSGETLSEVEFSQYTGWLGANLRHAEEAYLQYQAGRLDQDYFDSTTRTLVFYFRSAPSRAIFRTWKEQGIFTGGFADWFAAELASEYGEESSE